ARLAATLYADHATSGQARPGPLPACPDATNGWARTAFEQARCGFGHRGREPARTLDRSMCQPRKPRARQPSRVGARRRETVVPRRRRPRSLVPLVLRVPDARVEHRPAVEL